MSERNLELAYEAMAAVGRQDLPGLLSLTHPEVEWHSFFAELGGDGTYRGHEGIHRYVTDMNDAWDIVEPEIDGGIWSGETVLLVGHIHYRGRASGVEARSPAGWVFTFRDQKLTLFRAFHDPERMLASIATGP